MKCKNISKHIGQASAAAGAFPLSLLMNWDKLYVYCYSFSKFMSLHIMLKKYLLSNFNKKLAIILHKLS